MGVANLVHSDDYAVLTTKEYEFYYGYEYVYMVEGKLEDEYSDTWGFYVKLRSAKQIIFRRPLADMQPAEADRFDTLSGLLIGIGIWLNTTQR